MDNSDNSNKAAPTSTMPGSTAPRRRSSASPAFEGLMNQKRASDAASTARRQSLHDQKPQAGFFGQMWNTFTRGPTSPTSK